MAAGAVWLAGAGSGRELAQPVNQAASERTQREQDRWKFKTRLLKSGWTGCPEMAGRRIAGWIWGCVGAMPRAGPDTHARFHDLAPMPIRRLTPDDAAAYRELRLRALREHPEAFTSDWQTERSRPPEESRQRLASVSVPFWVATPPGNCKGRIVTSHPSLSLNKPWKNRLSARIRDCPDSHAAHTSRA